MHEEYFHTHTHCGIMRGFTTELGVGQCVINRTEPAKVLSNEESGLFTNTKYFKKQNNKVLQRQNIGFIKLLPTVVANPKFLRPGPSRLGASLPSSGRGLASGLASDSASDSAKASPARQVLSVLPPGSLVHNRHHLS